MTATTAATVDHAAYIAEAPAPAPPYFLAKHVFCCLSERSAVLLDLKRDKYLAVPRDGLEAIGIDLPQGASRLENEQEEGATRELEVEAAARELLLQGLITSDAGARNPMVPTSMTAASRTLRETVGDDSVQWAARHGKRQCLKDFLFAATAASVVLRYGRFERVVNALAHRRVHRRGDRRDVNLDACADLVAAFERFRPLFPRQYLCLFDSLALLKLLARHDQYPQWVFGVQTAPFAAHCWVQYGDVVLNDTVEEVRAYTPIMVV